MPFFEEKFVCPLAIRFSQARIRPTFQDGRCVEASRSEIQAATWPLDDADGYDVLLKAPFPPIEIIRWTPKIREVNGSKCVDDDGNLKTGDPCWFTFDNRRLYCLQAAAVAAWPKRAAAVVHVMMDLPLTRSAPRKFKTTDLGGSIRIARRDDAVPRSIWSWEDAVRTFRGESGDAQAAMDRIAEDVAKDSLQELRDVPSNGIELKPSVGSVPVPAVASTAPVAHRSVPSGGYRSGVASTTHARPVESQVAPSLSLERALLVSPERSPSTASASTSAPSAAPRTSSRTASLGSSSPELAPALGNPHGPPPLPTIALGGSVLPSLCIDDEEEESNCETQ